MLEEQLAGGVVCCPLSAIPPAPVEQDLCVLACATMCVCVRVTFKTFKSTSYCQLQQPKVQYVITA